MAILVYSNQKEFLNDFCVKPLAISVILYRLNKLSTVTISLSPGYQ